MAVIKRSKIFISIRHPHATCIINVQRKDAGTFTPATHIHTLFHHHIPSAHNSQLLHLCVCLCRGGSKKWNRGWATSSNTPQGGQRLARLHSGTSFSHLHSRCVVLLFHCLYSLWECFCWENSIFSLPLIKHSAFCGVGVLPSLLLLLLFNSSVFMSIPQNTCERFAEVSEAVWCL